MALNHAKAGEIVDVSPLGPQLKNSRTTAIVKTDAFEAVRLVIDAGASIPSHKVAGQITIHCLEGRVEIGLGNRHVVLGPNNWIYLGGGETHSLRGLEDASLLLTILFVK